MNIQVYLKMACPYTNELIRNVLEEQNGLFTLINSSTIHGDQILYWLEYEDIDFEMLYRLTKQSTDQKILANSFCIRKGLLRKANFALFIQKYLSKVKQKQIFFSKNKKYFLFPRNPIQFYVIIILKLIFLI